MNEKLAVWVRPCTKCGKKIQIHENAVWRRVDDELTSYHLACAGENPNPPPKAQSRPKKPPKAKVAPKAVTLTSPFLPASVAKEMSQDEFYQMMVLGTLTLTAPTTCPVCHRPMPTGTRVQLSRDPNDPEAPLRLTHPECLEDYI